MSWSTHGLSSTLWSSSTWSDGGTDVLPQRPYTAALSAALVAIGEFVRISGSLGTATSRAIVSQPSADEMMIGFQKTNAQRNMLIMRRSEYPGVPKLGDTVETQFRFGGRKIFKVTAEDGGSRVFRHVDPQGEFLRIHVVLTESTHPVAMHPPVIATTTTAGE